MTAGLDPADAYPDYRDVIARDDVGVVDVCVPPHVRREIVIAAAQAGKHILSEKPIATVPADGAAMVEAARSAGVTLGLVHNYLFQPEIVLARQLITSGALGQVEMVDPQLPRCPRLSGQCRVPPDLAPRPGPVRRRHPHRHHPPRVSRGGAARPPHRAGLGLCQRPDDGRGRRGHRLVPLRDARQRRHRQRRLELRSRRGRRARWHRGQRHARPPRHQLRERRHVRAIPRAQADRSRGHACRRHLHRGAGRDRATGGGGLRGGRGRGSSTGGHRRTASATSRRWWQPTSRPRSGAP